MPIYEYRCGACDHRLDALQKLSDPPLTDCPDCGAAALRKLMSAPVFRLKGGGWYETDFKSDKDKRRNLAERRETAGKDGAGQDGAGQDGAGKSSAPTAKDSAGSDKSKSADSAPKVTEGKDSTTKASGTKGAGTAAA